MLIQLLRIKSRLLVQFRVYAVVYWLILRSRGLASRPGLVLGKKPLVFTVPLLTQEYKWIQANFQGSLMKINARR